MDHLANAKTPQGHLHAISMAVDVGIRSYLFTSAWSRCSTHSNVPSINRAPITAHEPVPRPATLLSGWTDNTYTVGMVQGNQASYLSLYRNTNPAGVATMAKPIGGMYPQASIVIQAMTGSVA